MSISTLTRKGQTTIPINVRNHLKLRPGDKIEFVIERDGRVLVRTPEEVGYERIEEKLCALGAKIRRVSEAGGE